MFDGAQGNHDLFARMYRVLPAFARENKTESVDRNGIAEFVLDEPFAAIDAKVRKELRSWLRELINRVGITSIFVTHDQDEAIEVADQIIVTNKGRIEQVGTPYA